jgi:hypothetical protein
MQLSCNCLFSISISRYAKHTYSYLHLVPKFLLISLGQHNKCSIEMFIKLALTLIFKRQHRKLSWLDKDSDKDQRQLDELFN